jgi:hypothetical protein
MRKKLLVPLAVMLTLASATVASVALAHPLGTANFVNDPNGIIKLQAGYSYTTVAVMCTPARSTESGVTFPLPEDPDGNVLFQAPSGEMWLLNNHELTQPRPGDFGGDVGKCHVPEQRPGDDDSDGWGSVSRLTLDKDGTTVKLVEVITTGLHNLCAAAITPWKTYLTNEEFPFINDPELRSGWVWEIDPETGASKRLTGMGRFSHEQEAYASDGNWYLTDDRGDARFIYKFEPTPDARDLTTGELYGLAFNKATMTGTWIGPLNPLDPDSDMRARFPASRVGLREGGRHDRARQLGLHGWQLRGLQRIGCGRRPRPDLEADTSRQRRHSSRRGARRGGLRAPQPARQHPVQRRGRPLHHGGPQRERLPARDAVVEPDLGASTAPGGCGRARPLR